MRNWPYNLILPLPISFQAPTQKAAVFVLQVKLVWVCFVQSEFYVHFSESCAFCPWSRVIKSLFSFTGILACSQSRWGKAETLALKLWAFRARLCAVKPVCARVLFCLIHNYVRLPVMSACGSETVRGNSGVKNKPGWRLHYSQRVDVSGLCSTSKLHLRIKVVFLIIMFMHK